MEKPRWVDEKELAQRYGCSVHKLRRDRHLRIGLPYAKFGGLCRYNLQDCDEIMRGSTIRMDAQPS